MDWGTLRVRPWNLRRLAARLNTLLEEIAPNLIIVPTTLDVRRGKKAKQALLLVETTAERRGTPVRTFSLEETQMTRHERAELAQRIFPELRSSEIRERGPGDSEDEKVEPFLAARRAWTAYSSYA